MYIHIKNTWAKTLKTIGSMQTVMVPEGSRGSSAVVLISEKFTKIRQ